MGAMLRSAASAGAGIANAKTNANDAVLAHSHFVIADLDQMHPALLIEIRVRRIRVH
jgi:hypothetical protein